ncbi:unnamed protein product [Phytomonas sp. Hart1]|nr:unnamed protein product [Phytomonas sp. Hart1]|eukprot:CCW69942.1 unnamed protein product [Phytomonas sp. isolate Hart1]
MYHRPIRQARHRPRAETAWRRGRPPQDFVPDGEDDPPVRSIGRVGGRREGGDGAVKRKRLEEGRRRGERRGIAHRNVRANPLLGPRELSFYEIFCRVRESRDPVNQGVKSV